MITNSNKKQLDIILANLSFDDWYSINGKLKIGKRSKPYSLSSETLEVKEMLNNANCEDITQEQEEEIKSFLLKIRFSREYLLKEPNIYKADKMGFTYNL